MRPLEGSFFVVRVKGYPQQKGYTDFCLDAVKALLQEAPENYDHMLSALSDKIKEYRKNDAPRDTIGSPLVYGAFINRHDGTSLATKLVGRYEPAFAEALQRLWPDEASMSPLLQYQFMYRAHDQREGEQDIVLSQIERKMGVGQITNRWDNDNQCRLRQELNWTYCEATNPQNDKETRFNRALECYYLYCHEMPFEAGSAMGGQLLLAYLLDQAGVSYLPAREGVDLNLEALLRSVDDFKHAYKTGELLDKGALSETMHDWQENEGLRAEKPQVSLKDIVEMAFEMREGGVISNGEKYLMKRFIEKPEEATDENPFPQRVEFRETEYGAQQVRFITLHDFVNHALYDQHPPTLQAARYISQELLKETWHDRPASVLREKKPCKYQEQIHHIAWGRA